MQRSDLARWGIPLSRKLCAVWMTWFARSRLSMPVSRMLRRGGLRSKLVDEIQGAIRRSGPGNGRTESMNARSSTVARLWPTLVTNRVNPANRQALSVPLPSY